MDQRVQFIADYQRNEFDLADLARRVTPPGRCRGAVRCVTCSTARG
jgi:hypothetical protein